MRKDENVDKALEEKDPKLSLNMSFYLLMNFSQDYLSPEYLVIVFRDGIPSLIFPLPLTYISWINVRPHYVYIELFSHLTLVMCVL